MSSIGILDSIPSLSSSSSPTRVRAYKRKQSSEPDTTASSSNHHDAVSVNGASVSPSSTAVSSSSPTHSHPHSSSSSSLFGPDSVLAHVLKKARTQQQSEESVPSQPQSAFLRLLSHDANSASIILQFLEWSELAALVGCCHQSQSFVSNPRNPIQKPGEMCRINISWKEYQSLCTATWIRARVESLILSDVKDQHVDLSSLQSFSRLIQLELQLPPIAFEQSVIDSVSKLTFLKQFSMHNSLGASQMSEPQLAELIVQGQTLSFAPLKQLSQLQKFDFRPSHHYFASKTQIQDIVQITSLTELECGIIAEHYPTLDVGRSREEFMGDTIAQLHKLPKLQCMNLRGATITPDLWHHLCKCTSLTEIDPFSFEDGIDWAELTNWKHTLALFSYSAPIWEGQVHFPPSFLAALSQCSLLENLTFGNVEFSAEEMKLVCTQLPNLKTLTFIQCKFESVAALAETIVEDLRLQHCINSQSRNFQWPVELPVMRELCKLEITEQWFANPPQWDPSINPRGMMRTLLYCYKNELARRMPSLKCEDIWVYWQVAA